MIYDVWQLLQRLSSAQQREKKKEVEITLSTRVLFPDGRRFTGAGRRGGWGCSQTGPGLVTPLSAIGFTFDDIQGAAGV